VIARAKARGLPARISFTQLAIESLTAILISVALYLGPVNTATGETLTEFLEATAKGSVAVRNAASAT
jgi:hypothetical protein